MSTGRLILSVNFLSAIGLIVGLLNNLLIAKYFGLSSQVDAYFAAFAIPALFMTLFADFAGKNFLPIYAELMQKDEHRASRFVSAAINIVLVIVVVLLGMIIVGASTLLSRILPGFTAEGLRQATLMLQIMTPVLLFMAVNMFHEYVLMYRDQYRRVVVSKMCLPFVSLIALVSLHDSIGEYALPVGFLLGHLVLSVVLAYKVGYQYHLSVSGNRGEITRLLKNTSILSGSGFIARIRPLIERYFASTLPEGSITALAMAGKICTPLQQTSLMGIRMLAFNKAAKYQASGKLNDVAELSNLVIRSSLCLLTPLVVWTMINAHDVVFVLFERGQFTAGMTEIVAAALVALVPSVIFLGVGQILSNTFYVMDKVVVPAVLGVLSTIIYYGLVVSLVNKYGVMGLAASITITAILSFCTLIMFLKKELHALSIRLLFLSFIRYVVLAAFVLFVIDWLFSMTEIIRIVKLGLTMLLGIGLYLGVLLAVRDAGLSSVISRLKKNK